MGGQKWKFPSKRIVYFRMSSEYKHGYRNFGIVSSC